MIDSIVRNARMYIASQKYKLRSFFTYRTQAIIWIIAFMLSSTYQIVVATLIYANSKGISGWSYYQILALGGLSNIFFGFMFFTLSPHFLGRLMRNGQLDQELVKPYNPVLMLLSITGSVPSIGFAITGVVTLAYASVMAHISFFSLLPMLIIFILGALDIILFELVITLSAYVAFRSTNFVQWIMNIGKNTSSYPLTVYGVAGLALLTICMPVGLATFFPAEEMFGKLAVGEFLLFIIFETIAAYAYYKISSFLITKYSSGGG